MEEHPDVFNDPNFSVSMTVHNSCHDDMEISLPQDFSNVHTCMYKIWSMIILQLQDVLLGNGNSTASKTMESMEYTGGGVGLDAPTQYSPTHTWSKQDTIPEDPVLAETHYTEVYHICMLCIA